MTVCRAYCVTAEQTRLEDLVLALKRFHAALQDRTFAVAAVSSYSVGCLPLSPETEQSPKLIGTRAVVCVKAWFGVYANDGCR